MVNLEDLLNNNPPDGQRNQPLPKEEYAAKKQAEREEIFKLSDNTAMEVAANGGKFQQYLDVQAKFDRYSAVNALLIMAQKPESTIIGSFEHWKYKDAFVKSGQTAFSILEPHEYINEDGSTRTGYNIKKMFDISQVDARRVKAAPIPYHSSSQILKALIKEAPAKITCVDELPGGFGAVTNHGTGEISVRKGMEYADIFRCLAKELAGINLAAGNNVQSDIHFSAYCAAYILCKKYGVDTHNFDFTNARVVFDNMDAQTIKRELSRIRDTAHAISGRMAKQLDAPQKAARAQEVR